MCLCDFYYWGLRSTKYRHFSAYIIFCYKKRKRNKLVIYGSTASPWKEKKHTIIVTLSLYLSQIDKRIIETWLFYTLTIEQTTSSSHTKGIINWKWCNVIHKPQANDCSIVKTSQQQEENSYQLPNQVHLVVYNPKVQ